MSNEHVKSSNSVKDSFSAKSLTELSTIAKQLAESAGELLMDYRTKITQVSTKSNINDLVTEADRESERLVADGIRSARPMDGILGEEGARTNPESRIQWIIDPLDGTTNYLYGCGPFGVSIGVELDGQAVVGVVQAPLTNETYSAIIGQGAFCNDTMLSLTQKKDFATAIIGCDGSTDAEVRIRQAKIVSRVFTGIRDLRRIGSCAISMCWVAAGRYDGFFAHGVGQWDISAGTVIAREAGAWVGSAASDVPTLAETIVAAPGIVEELRRAVS